MYVNPHSSSANYAHDTDSAHSTATQSANQSTDPNQRKENTNKPFVPTHRSSKALLLHSLLLAQQTSAVPSKVSAMRTIGTATTTQFPGNAASTFTAACTAGGPEPSLGHGPLTSTSIEIPPSVTSTVAPKSGQTKTTMPLPTAESASESSSGHVLPMWAAAAGGAAAVSLGAQIIASRQAEDPDNVKDRLLQIPSCAQEIIFRDETKEQLISLIRECHSVSPDSYDPQSRDIRYLRRYIHELESLRNGIGNIEKAGVSYYPFGGSDTLTIDTLAPDASIHIMTHHAEYAMTSEHMDVSAFLENDSAHITGDASFGDGRLGNFDSGVKTFNVTLPAIRAIIGQLYRKLSNDGSGHASFPEAHVAKLAFTKNGDVIFGAPSDHLNGATGGTAIWIKDGNQTKLFLCKAIDIEETNQRQTKTDIKGLRALLAKVSKDAGTLVLQKAVPGVLLPVPKRLQVAYEMYFGVEMPKEVGDEVLELTRDMMTPPQAKVLAVVCDKGPPSLEGDALPVYVKGLGPSAEVRMPLGFGHGNIARIYAKKS